MRILIVEDNSRLAQLIAKGCGGEGFAADLCSSIEDARAVLAGVRHDAVILDLGLPDGDGLQLLAGLRAEGNDIPVLVLTARDALEARVQGLNAGADDYLLKPFDRDRFIEALSRARAEHERRQAGDVKRQLLALLEDVESRRDKYPPRLVIKSSGRVVFLKVEDVDWVDAAGNYVRIHAGEESHMLRETMGRLEERLDPEKFLRIHRSTIVNIERIRELQQQFHGDYLVVLKNGQRLTLSRSYRDRIQELLDRSI